MNRAQATRGPDGEGVLVSTGIERQAFLGHCRLAIIDIAGGDQPMVEPDSGLVVVFNGEIYNHEALRAELEAKGARFRSRSDTEVLLHGYRQWGPRKLLSRIDGMYAFALWDPRADELFLARDPAGQKPLLYFQDRDGRLAFASTMAALRQVPGFDASLDPEALELYFSLRFIPAPRTCFRRVRKLVPGEALRFVRGRMERFTHFSAFAQEGQGVPAGDAVADFEARLRQSVADCLVADVPVSLLLSSGLDSGCLAVALSESVQGLHVACHTVAFPDSNFDESATAAHTARERGLAHEILPLDELETRARLDQFLDGLDEPFGDPSIVPSMLLCARVRERTKAAMGGDGGDELFGGYPTFQVLGLWDMYRRLPRAARVRLAPLVRLLPDGGSPYSARRKAERFLQAEGGDGCSSLVRWLSIYPPRDLSKLLGPGAGLALDRLTKEECPGLDRCEPVERMSRLYFRYFLPGVLEKVDRASMANSLEVRAPYLQKGMIRFGLGLPAAWKIRGARTKLVVREWLQGRLPATVVEGRKRGFCTPVDGWMANSLGKELETHLREGRVREVVDSGYALELLGRFRSGERLVGQRLWLIHVLARWMEAC